MEEAALADLPTGPRQARSTVLSVEEEAVIVAFRRYTLLPLDDCLYALQPTIPHLTRSSLHRYLADFISQPTTSVGGSRPLCLSEIKLAHTDDEVRREMA
jgi:hypothetical protein